jgi:hypothetical protein
MLRLLFRAALVPAGFLLILTVTHAVVGGAPLAAHPGLAQPLAVATSWSAFGTLLWTIAWVGILVATAGYFVVLRFCLHLHRVPVAAWWIVAGTCGAALLAALYLPVIFSSDVYAYAAYGDLQAHGISPYAHTQVPLTDPLLRAAVWQWSNPLPVCVYGPLFVEISRSLVLWAASWGVAAPLLALRVLSCFALLACGPLLALTLPAPSSANQRLTAFAGILLNPVTLWIAAEGHNDALVLAFVLAGFLVVRRFGYFAGAFIIASSALIKASGVAAAFVFALFAWRVRERFAQVAAGIASAILLTALLARPFEAGVRTVLIPHGHYSPQFSAQFAISEMLRILFGRGVPALELGIAIVVVAAGALGLRGARLALAGDLQGAAYIALALWLLIPDPYPWYGLWILPVAFLCWGTRIAWALIAATITIFLRYLPDVSGTVGNEYALLITAGELIAPLVILFYQPASARQSTTVLESDSSA